MTSIEAKFMMTAILTLATRSSLLVWTMNTAWYIATAKRKKWIRDSYLSLAIGSSKYNYIVCVQTFFGSQQILTHFVILTYTV